MKREQYTGLLKAYLEKESRANMDYVLADCNAYFDVAEEQGFTDEEIIESLGSPKAVYEVCYREGKMASGSYLTQVKLALNRGRQLLEKTGAQGRMAGSPREDRAGMGKMRQILCNIGVYAGYIMAALVMVATLTILYLSAIQFQPIAELTPLPVLSPITRGLFAGVGITFSVTFAEIGRHCDILYNKYRGL
ncbi:hypothetical protein [Allisonella histaminiformans]|uniref:hypothetical protein n=1 Tax=Allisonella histaminiformans TaxID=209880 RepID=UPI00307CFF39